MIILSFLKEVRLGHMNIVCFLIVFSFFIFPISFSFTSFLYLLLISHLYCFVASSCLSLLLYFPTLIENFTPLPFAYFTSLLLHLNISSPVHGSFSSFTSFSSSVFSSSFYFSAVFHVHTRTVLHSETLKYGDVRISTQLHRPSA